MLEYTVSATRTGPPAFATGDQCPSAVLALDTDPAGRTDAFNPAELLLAAVAACMLKGIERVIPLLKFRLEGATVRVHGVRQDAPPTNDANRLRSRDRYRRVRPAPGSAAPERAEIRHDLQHGLGRGRTDWSCTARCGRRRERPNAEDGRGLIAATPTPRISSGVGIVPGGRLVLRMLGVTRLVEQGAGLGRSRAPGIVRHPAPIEPCP